MLGDINGGAKALQLIGVTVIEISGTGLAPLVASWALRRQGLRSFLGRSWDPGFFGGHLVGGRQLDHGCILIENFREVGLLAPSQYLEHGHLPERDSHNPVVEFFNTFGVSVAPVSVYSVVGSSLTPDFVIADELDVLARFTDRRQPNTPKNLHPQFKHENDLVNISLREAVLRIYSQEYAEWYLGVLDSWFPGVAGLIPANLHRIIWAPLYWPETLSDSNSNSSVQKQVFFSADGSLASALSMVASQLRADLAETSSRPAPWLKVDISPRAERSLGGSCQIRTIIFEGFDSCTPLVAHDLEGSGLFRLSLNLGHGGHLMIEAHEGTDLLALTSRVREILLKSAAFQGSPKDFGMFLSPPIVDRTVSLRFPTLEVASQLEEVPRRSRTLFTRSAMDPTSLTYSIQGDFPFNSVNGQFLAGIEVASDLKRMLHEPS